MKITLPCGREFFVPKSGQKLETLQALFAIILYMRMRRSAGCQNSAEQMNGLRRPDRSKEDIMEMSTGQGSVKIADEVIEVISGMAASQVEGVAAMGVGGLVSDIANMFSRNPGKGIKVEMTDNEVRINLFLTVEYGVAIPTIAEKVQAAVKEAVESMTGLTVTEITIHIQGIACKDTILVSGQASDDEE